MAVRKSRKGELKSNARKRVWKTVTGGGVGGETTGNTTDFKQKVTGGGRLSEAFRVPTPRRKEKTTSFLKSLEKGEETKVCKTRIHRTTSTVDSQLKQGKVGRQK